MTIWLYTSVISYCTQLDENFQYGQLCTIDSEYALQGWTFQTMSEASASSYNSNYRGHVYNMDQCVLWTSLQLHNFSRQFYGCRHWKPVSINCACYHRSFIVKVAMLLNSCTYQLCLICKAAMNIVSPLSSWMASHVGVELKQHQLSLRNLLGLRPRQLWQKTMRWKPMQ